MSLCLRTTIVTLLLTAVTADCPCLSFEESVEKAKQYSSDDGGCLVHNINNKEFCFPSNYGVGECDAHDEFLAPYCDKVNFPGNPDWCTKQWCWVDPSNCDQPNSPSSFFPSSELYYSYATCGSKNTFDLWNNGDEDRKFSDFIGLLERYITGVKQSIEPLLEEIKEYSQTADAALECTPSDSCETDCESCEYQSCWGTFADFQGTSVTPRRFGGDSTNADKTLKCLARSLNAQYTRIALNEYRDTDQIAYQYYGDQQSGSLVQWPGTEFCPAEYDARFRPWYASAVSGQKDLVIVIDVSGSMSTNNRIEMAKLAVQQVVKTLSWVDFFTVITFNDDYKDVYSFDLVQATEDNIEDAVRWAETYVKAAGGTDFEAPLSLAYSILNKAVTGRETPCAQAVLFMTDGEAPFSSDKMQNLHNGQEDVVIFSYGLGEGAKSAPLQEMACTTNGIYYPIRDEQQLPSQMAAYYEYYAALQDSCKVTWVKYTDALSGTQLVGGCSAVYDYQRGENGTYPAPLLGVTCQDLNTIVSLDVLSTCGSGGFQNFVDQIQAEAANCPIGNKAGSGGVVRDPCWLQMLRWYADEENDIHCGEERCEYSDIPREYPTESSCDGLNPNRFDDNVLQECSSDVPPTCVNPETNTPIIFGGIAGGVLVVCAVVFYFKTKRASTSSTTMIPAARPDIICTNRPIAIANASVAGNNPKELDDLPVASTV